MNRPCCWAKSYASCHWTPAPNVTAEIYGMINHLKCEKKNQDKITIKCVFSCYWSTFGNESRIIHSLLHMMRPYQETTTCSASTEEVMSRTLHHELEVMLLCEVDCCLNITLRSSIDTNRWDASLFTWNSQGGVQVTCWYSIVVEYERLEIGVLHRSWLIWTPITVRVVGDYNWTVGGRCWWGVACRCGGEGVEKRLRYLAGQCGELVCVRPARVSIKTAASRCCIVGHHDRKDEEKVESTLKFHTSWKLVRKVDEAW